MYIVTGATGFIGSAMVWELNQQGVSDIICVDVGEDVSCSKNLIKRTYSKYVTKNDLLLFLNQNSKKIKGIFHMGACSSTTVTDRDYVMETNLEYSQKLFQWAQENNCRFIYASSAATYGAGELGYNDNLDSELLKPLNLYGESKVLFDRWIHTQKIYPAGWAGLKFFNVYGPQEYDKGNMASVVFKAFKQIQETSSLRLFKSNDPKYADGAQMRDFVYIKDITLWMWQIMQNDSIIGIFNMGYGRARTWLDLARNVFMNMGKHVNIEWIEIPDNIKNQYQNFTEAQIGKLLQAGASKPQWSLEEGIQDYIQNYLLQADPYL